MRLDGKLVGNLTQADMQQLLDDRRIEDAYLDYKRDAYGKADSDKRELLKDVVGLANASGGVILIGIEEDKANAAVAIPGVDIDINQKDPMERYERTIRDGIEPRLTGFAIQAVRTGQTSKVVIAIGVTQSLNRPHRVKAANSERWIIRHNRDNIDMTYTEIRNAFLDTANIQKRALEFQIKRCEEIRAERRSASGVLVVHVIPISARDTALDVRAAIKHQPFFFPPGLSDRFPLMPNFNGVRAQGQIGDGQWWGWCQIYRDGTVEGVSGNFVAGDRNGKPVLHHGQIEVDVFEAVAAYVKGIATLGFNPPYAVALSLVSASGSYINNGRILVPNSYLDLVAASFEPVIIKLAKLTGQWHSVIQPVFDQLWNAYGFVKCDSFDATGVWRRPIV